MTITTVIGKAPSGTADAMSRRVPVLANARRHCAADRPVTVLLEETAGRVRMVVTDSGEGIPPDEVPHIFDRYFRGKSALAYPGAGLGLNLVERIMKRHHGTVTAQSTVGVGTQIVLSLPRGGGK